MPAATRLHTSDSKRLRCSPRPSSSFSSGEFAQRCIPRTSNGTGRKTRNPRGGYNVTFGGDRHRMDDHAASSRSLEPPDSASQRADPPRTAGGRYRRRPYRHGHAGIRYRAREMLLQGLRGQIRLSRPYHNHQESVGQYTPKRT